MLLRNSLSSGDTLDVDGRGGAPRWLRLIEPDQLIIEEGEEVLWVTQGGPVCAAALLVGAMFKVGGHFAGAATSYERADSLGSTSSAVVTAA